MLLRARTVRLVLVSALGCCASAGVGARQPVPAFVPAPPPVFANPNRVAALTGALPGLDPIFLGFVARAHVPGAAWGILVDGRLVHTGSAGVRETASHSPVNANTIFRIASMTKSFTALSILNLRDAGRLSLDDPAEKYVPQMKQLVYPTADAPRITIRLLLSHAEGFPEDNPWGDRQLADSDQQLLDMIEHGIPFSNPPAQAYEYSNLGFAILGRIVSQASGMPYREYVQRTILTPLGMTSTTFDPASVEPARLAHGYRFEDGTWKEEPLLADGSFGSMGGLLTSINDLAKWVGFQMSAWPARDEPDTGPVRRSSVREMQQVWRPAPATVTRERLDGPMKLNAGGYGFGLRVWQTCGQRHVVAHGGGLPGFGSTMRWLPEHGVAVIALGNLTYTGWTPAADAAIDALDATGALAPRVPRPAPALVDASNAVNRLIANWDHALADSIAADNLFLDESRERRRVRLEVLRAAHGVCRPDGAIDAENALRGTWKLMCDRGALRVGITLAPTAPPTVQFLSVTSIFAPAGAFATAFDRLVGQTGQPDAAVLRELTGSGTEAPHLQAQFAAAAAWGACRIGAVESGDGTSAAAVRLSCSRGALMLNASYDAKLNRFTHVALVPAGGQTCVQ